MAIVLVVIICLFYLPIMYGDFRFDLRVIPLLFLALFAGWRLTIPVLVVASLWRYVVIGGSAAVPAIVFALVVPTLFVLLFYRKRLIDSFEIKHFFVVSFCWLLSDVPVIFAMENGFEVFKQLGLIRYMSFLVVATMVHGLIINEIKKYRMQERLAYYANYCPLTGIRVRSSFLDLAERRLKALMVGECLAIGMIDVDQFKRLNDSYGHLAGDAVLERLGKVFGKYESESVIFGRYGGDEFIVLFLGLDESEISLLLEQLYDEVAEVRVAFEQVFIRVSLSIGVHIYEDESSLQELIHQADHAMYVHKLSKREVKSSSDYLFAEEV